MACRSKEALAKLTREACAAFADKGGPSCKFTRTLKQDTRETVARAARGDEDVWTSGTDFLCGRDAMEVVGRTLGNKAAASLGKVLRGEPADVMLQREGERRAKVAILVDDRDVAQRLKKRAADADLGHRLEGDFLTVTLEDD